MPAFLTHWYVLIETARRTQDAGSDLGSLIVDNTALRRRLSGLPTPPQTTPAGAVWDTGPLPEINYRFPGSDISAMAFLGALGPDIPGYQRRRFWRRISGTEGTERRIRSIADKPVSWDILLHTNRSGDFLLTLLEHIAEIPSPAIRSQALAFAMGYLSHMATDMALNPWINALAGIYRPKDIPGTFLPLGMHFYIKLCMDEYLALRYFSNDLYDWLNRPWKGYIEPAASNLSSPTMLASQILTLLTATVEATYRLNEEQSQEFRADYLSGLQRLRLYLAGRGTFRWLTFNAQVRQRINDPIPPILAMRQESQELADITTLDTVFAYAIRLSERFCRRAISYYASLRNTWATAEERSQRRTALRNDLQNWDLSTGYTLEVAYDQEVTLRFLHNWIYFADLWHTEMPNHPLAQETLAE